MTNNRTEEMLQTFNPELAIMVYKSNNGYYLESHNVDENGRIMEGKPLLQETVQGIVDVFFDERKNLQRFTGILPSNILLFELLPGGNYKMMWHQPAQQKVLQFKPELKLPTEKAWVPALLYKADAGRLEVFALKSDRRPVEGTKVYRAPFYNVNTDGAVCLGNATVKKPTERTYASLIKYWEDLFWLSEFSHVNGRDAVKTDIHKVWKRLLSSKGKIKWSDIDELVPTKLTIKNILK
jgi:PRTRC genetic system protein B